MNIINITFGIGRLSMCLQSYFPQCFDHVRGKGRSESPEKSQFHPIGENNKSCKSFFFVSAFSILGKSLLHALCPSVRKSWKKNFFSSKFYFLLAKQCFSWFWKTRGTYFGKNSAGQNALHNANIDSRDSDLRSSPIVCIVIGDTLMMYRRPLLRSSPLRYSEYVWGIYKWAWLQKIKKIVQWMQTNAADSFFVE